MPELLQGSLSWLHSWHYTPPDGGLYVPNPRTVTDIVFRSAAIHAFAIVAYAHLQRLRKFQSRRTRNLQVIAFALLPEFILVEFACNTFNAVNLIRRHLFRSGSSLLSWLNFLNVLLGVHIQDLETSDYDAPEFRAELLSDFLQHPVYPTTYSIGKVIYLRGMAWLTAALFLLLNAIPLAVTIFAYKQRLAMRYRSATYVANLGIDHCNAWAAIGGILAIAMSIPLLAINRNYVFRYSGGEHLRDSENDGRLPNTQEVSEESLEPTESKKNLHRYSNDAGEPTNGPSTNYILGQVAVATSLHQIPLMATNHISIWSGRPLVLLLGHISICAIWGGLKRRTFTWKSLLAAYFTIVFACTVLSQPYEDIMELVNAINQRVQPYNYRWKVKDIGSSATKIT